MFPIEIKASTALNFAGSINSEYKGWFKRGSIKLKGISVLPLTDGQNMMHALRQDSWLSVENRDMVSMVQFHLHLSVNWIITSDNYNNIYR